jgi:hypothetical protein
MSDSVSSSPEQTRVVLTASEPWDFVAADGSVSFRGLIVVAATFATGAEEERVVVRLDEPVTWHGQFYEFFVIRERHGHGISDDLRMGLPIECSLTAVDRDRLVAADPFDTSWWRGGLAGIATLRAEASGI